MIYLDSSVALAYLFVEGRWPPIRFGANRWFPVGFCNTRSGIEFTHAVSRRRILTERKLLSPAVSLIDLLPRVVARALEPFPMPVGTLDGLHVATIEFLRGDGREIELASYDRRLIDCARVCGVGICAL